MIEIIVLLITYEVVRRLTEYRLGRFERKYENEKC